CVFLPEASLFWELAGLTGAQANGGEVVILDKGPEVVRILKPGSENNPREGLSYKYIDDSIAYGRVPRGKALDAYKVKPSAPRPMGATHIPRKGTRTDFNLADDRILYDWVHQFEKTQDPLSGNRIYQDLAERFPQHPWQSWRGRYLRKLRGKPRPGGGVPRPDLLHGVGPESTRNHIQQLPLTTAQFRPSANLTSPTMSSGDSNSKRKYQSSPLTPNFPAEAAASSPTKRIKLESSEPPIFAGQSSSGDQLHSSSRTSNLATHSQAIPHTQHSHSTTHSTQSSPRTQSMHNPMHESLGNSHGQTDPNFLDLPFLSSSPEPDDGEESEEEDLPDVDGWINMQLARGGVDEDTIIAVLRSATMDQGLADKVLENWGAGSAVPDSMPGVWTAEDDRCLEAGDARDVQRVMTKHGEKLLNTRWEYLRMARERGLL
ncbi:uncharacterized protein N7443_008875, partial [Penicillium atrosanguineum]|uniref:uncharacterized protein n=1 Tax=Penicillium atrosanguineum TaxID=1132637 RepID=UPI002383B63A